MEFKGSDVMLILCFLVYTVFCGWVVFREGAHVIEGWKSFFLIDWFAASLTASELKLYVGFSWMAALAVLAYHLFSSA